MRWAVFVAAATAVGAAAVGAAALPAPAGAIATRPLVATASAQAVRVTYSVPHDKGVATPFDGGGPVSEASGDSTGRAETFASLPYPGETAVSSPGLMGDATGVRSAAGYPFYARAEYPTTRESSVADPSGTYVLRARADRGKADGEAALQFLGDGADSVSRSSATTHFALDERGNTTVVAETESWGLSFGGGALTIASVRSRSTTVYAQGSFEPFVSREVVIDGAKVFDQSVTIAPDGVKIDRKYFAQGPFADASQVVNAGLNQAGISVRLMTASGAGSASADVLEITARHPGAMPGDPNGTLAWRFGSVTTEVKLGS